MSTLKVNNLQVGQDGTPTNNYTLYQPASPDGTVRLGYGVSGSVTDILTLKNSRLGIGTNDPQASLHAHNASGTTLLRTSVNANSTVGFEIVKTGSTTQSWRLADGQTINGALEFYDVTNSTTRMIIRGGSVGINNSNPDTTYKLDVIGAGVFTTESNIGSNDFNIGQLTVKNNYAGAGAVIDFRADSNNGTQGVIAKIGGFNTYNGTGYDGALTFSTRNHSTSAMVERLRIVSSGNIGIGTDNPQGKLVVSNGSAGLEFNPNSDYAIVSYNRATSAFTPIGLQGSYQSFRIGGVGEVLRIDSSGKIGIGAFNNSSYDTNAQNVLIASDGNTGITIRSAGSSPYAMIHFADGTTGNSQKRAGRIMYQHDGDNLAFNTADTERIRITGTGRVGINVNPTTYANTDTALGLVIKNGHTSAEHTFLDIQNGINESGRIRFVDGDNGIAGQIYFSHNTARGGVSANCMGFFTGSNALRFEVQTDRVKVHGSTDGVLELDTTDNRGAFARFQENGTTKAWVGCSEGIGTGGDQDDLGLRAVGNIILRASARTLAKFTTGGATSFHVNSDDHETFRFTTQGVDEAKLIMKDASDNEDIVLNTGGDSWFRGGSLGINTTGPLAKLHVNLTETSGGSSGSRTKQHAAMRLSLDKTTGSMPYTGWGPALDFYSDNYDSSTQRPNARIAGVVSNNSVNDEGGQLRFYTTAADTASGESDFLERYRIESNGKIRHTGGNTNQGGNLGGGAYYRIVASHIVPASSSVTFIFAGLQSGWMTIRGGGYSNAGQSAFGVMYQLGGYMTATSTYNVVTVQQWIGGGSISVQKNASDYRVTITNNSGSYGLATQWCIESSTSVISVAY